MAKPRQSKADILAGPDAMLDRVARAINPAAFRPRAVGFWPPGAQVAAYADARAALLAMREPTMPVREKGATVFLDAIHPRGNDREPVRRIFTAMIDAILEGDV